jgi:hypothetical protein
MRMAPDVVRPVGLARDGMGRLGSSWVLAKTTPVDGWPGDHAALTATRCFRPRGAREDLLPIFEVIQLAHGQAPPEVAARLTMDPWTGQPIRRARVPR